MTAKNTVNAADITDRQKFIGDTVIKGDLPDRAHVFVSDGNLTIEGNVGARAMVTAYRDTQSKAQEASISIHGNTAAGARLHASDSITIQGNSERYLNAMFGKEFIGNAIGENSTISAADNTESRIVAGDVGEGSTIVAGRAELGHVGKGVTTHTEHPVLVDSHHKQAKSKPPYLYEVPSPGFVLRDKAKGAASFSQNELTRRSAAKSTPQGQAR